MFAAFEAISSCFVAVCGRGVRMRLERCRGRKTRDEKGITRKEKRDKNTGEVQGPKAKRRPKQVRGRRLKKKKRATGGMSVVWGGFVEGVKRLKKGTSYHRDKKSENGEPEWKKSQGSVLRI